MGSGKTTALIDWLSVFLDSEDKSVVIVSCRRSFTNSLSRRFQREGLTGFTTYLDSDEYVLTEALHRRLLIQLESLQRVPEALLDRYDVVVIDEVMSIMAQFFSPTMRRLRLVDSMFASLLRGCRHIIAMDATVNATLVELLADLRGPENIHVVVNDFVSRGFANRECVVMSALGAALPVSMMVRSTSPSQSPPKSHHLATASGMCYYAAADEESYSAMDAIATRTPASYAPPAPHQAHPSALYCPSSLSCSSSSSSAYAHHPQQQLHRAAAETDSAHQAPDAEMPTEESVAGSFFYELRDRLLSGENVCVFSSTLAFSRIVAFFCAGLLGRGAVLLLNSTSPLVDTSDWSRYKVVVYTTVVTVGLSFDDFHFHTMFAFVKPSIHGPDMMAVYQAMGRVRSLIHDRLFMYLDVSCSSGGPTFTPMLLDSEWGGTASWPPEIFVPANAMCLRFRDRCSSALLDHQMALFSRFKAKHYLERSTLTSANDSFSLLHTLLSNNRISVRVRCDHAEDRASLASVEEWGRFLSRLRADAFVNRQFIRQLSDAAEEAAAKCREYAALPEPSDEETALWLSETPAARRCMERFFGLPGSVEDYSEPILALLKSLGEGPAAAVRLVNAAIVEAGCTCDATEWLEINVSANHAPHGASEFDAWMSYYLDEPLVALKRGRPEEAQIPNQPGIRGRNALLRACVTIARQIGWRPTTWNDNEELDVASVEAAVGDAIESGLGKFALEYMRLNFTEPAWLTGPVRNLQRFLGEYRRGKRGRRPGSPQPLEQQLQEEPQQQQQQKESPEICIFRTLWAELFGVRILKSQRTFPGTTRVKNLRKEHLRSLLDGVGVTYSDKSSHKYLYALLRDNKHLFGNSRKLLLRTPDWMRQLSGNRPPPSESFFG